jgi:starch phosphorylase
MNQTAMANSASDQSASCQPSNPKLPACISKLDELAHNMWWSWHPRARDLFRALDYQLWEISGHNPVKQLRDISPYKLQAAAADPKFLSLYDSVVSSFDAAMSTDDTWFDATCPGSLGGPVAFFSMEFAIHHSLPIYAGGLGILAGDICKESSDLGIPLVGVGFMYPQGYFQQRISADGWQGEACKEINFYEAPIRPIMGAKERRGLVTVELDKRPVHIGAWQVQVGRTTLYLLDTDLEKNDPQDRRLSSHLYIADKELRIQQEIVLGIGGVRMLRALGIKPSVWHANEGHIGFMALERVREMVEKRVPLDTALQRVKETTIFTTHTPVPAGHDVFPVDFVEKYFKDYWQSLSMDRKTFTGLGQQDHDGGQEFNMTALSLRTSERCNAVSRLHGSVSRRMWKGLWPGRSEDQVPIDHVTNGIHVPTWIAPEMADLYEKYLGPDWWKRQDDSSLWQKVVDIPNEELWAVRQLLKRKLMSIIHDRVQKGWSNKELSPDQVPAMGALLNQAVLTIGFVRRFAEYKRPALIFQDIERLRTIVKDPWRPVQIVFAGKSHPADFPGKELLHHVYSLAADREFGGRIAFVEDYNMYTARYLVHGVDVWLNCPRRLQEASGTSGMKASLNGVPHLSVLDGWWLEGYNGANGWAIGSEHPSPNQQGEDQNDSAAIYQLLEEEIIPLFYNRDRNGVPHGWMHVVKEVIRSVAPVFCAQRMMKEYAERMYVPAALGPQRKGGRRKATEKAGAEQGVK